MQTIHSGFLVQRGNKTQTAPSAGTGTVPNPFHRLAGGSTTNRSYDNGTAGFELVEIPGLRSLPADT